MTAPRALALFAAAVTLAAPAASAADCRRLLENADLLAADGVLNLELVGNLGFYHLAGGVCVWRTEPASEPLCRATTAPAPGEAVRPPGNPEWNGRDLREDLMQIFSNTNNYAACRDIFESDRVLAAALARLPAPTEDDRRRFGPRAPTRVELGLPARTASTAPPTEIQLKMAAIFDAMPPWAYCSGAMTQSGVRVYADFYPQTRQVKLYNGACAPRDLYELDVAFAPSAFAGALIAAHEVGHAIEEITGGPWRGRKQAEAQATYYGTMLAECVSRRSDEFFAEIRRFVDLAERDELTPEMKAAITPTTDDLDYARCALDHLSGWSKYFRAVRKEINLTTGEMPRDLRAVMSETGAPPR